ncbi:synaptic vesicle glycoprotein 2B-like [Kryptolebias marmoratus]|uniref:synaptic vesicle glycoprotein 2B-like n=1 Tax=Kryptolebias marmoratus TaxID=37003 RepID=UPI0018ACB342|nr:synaptic vesicle glycoprotein 2B-like [Kryptolebias marmoratus]
MADPYQNNIYQQGGGDSYGTYGEGGGQDGYGYQADYPSQEEDAASDVTEGHDEEDQMYEGEYQGIPHPDEVKAAQRAARAKSRAAGSSVSELEELSEQYEDIMEDCGHGRFQWMLFVVLGLALMADSVECFVVAFVLPSAEKDLCLSNAEKGMLAICTLESLASVSFSSNRFLIWTLQTWVIMDPADPGHLDPADLGHLDPADLGHLDPADLGHLDPADPGQVTHIKAPKTAEDEFIEIQSATGTPVQRWAVRSFTLCKLVLRNVASLLSAELRFATLFMAIIWFCMAFSYYGLSVWFPDMIKHLQYKEYESKVKTFHRERVENFHFNFSLENQIHQEGEYIRDKFVRIEMKSVRFEDSLFEDCLFEDIRSTDTVFENCTIRSTVFYNTDLWEEKFIDCRMENTTFEHNKHGCHLDTVEENDVLIYLVSFLGSLAVLPGNIISALFVEKLGRVKIIGGSMLISAGCSFLLFLSFSQSTIIALQCLFCGVSAAAWNSIEVVTVELYPASKRATAFGVLNALCKLAAVLGSSIFASFVGITKAVPILLSFTALVCGGLVALKLPDTRQKILQ